MFFKTCIHSQHCPLLLKESLITIQICSRVNLVLFTCTSIWSSHFYPIRVGRPLCLQRMSFSSTCSHVGAKHNVTLKIYEHAEYAWTPKLLFFKVSLYSKEKKKYKENIQNQIALTAQPISWGEHRHCLSMPLTIFSLEKLLFK